MIPVSAVDQAEPPIPSGAPEPHGIGAGVNRVLDFIALDLETTGLDFETEEMLEIGAVRYRRGVPEAEFTRLVRPTREVTGFITALTGITAESAAAAMPPAEAVREFVEFAGDLPFVAHNAHFDRHFLSKACDAAGFALGDRRWFDTLLGARFAWPTQPTHRLESLGAALELAEPDGASHRALADARVAARLFLRVQDEVGALSDEVRRSLAWVLRGSRSPWKEILPSSDSNAPAPVLAPGRDEEPGRSAPARPGHVRSDALQDAFSAGLAAIRPGFEVRDAQRDMAKAVAAAFEDEVFLAAEAGTGTGKSLAYLLPAALWAMDARDRVVVATATKTLQNQLIEREVPTVAALVGDGLRVAVLKGRQNYLCVRRFSEHLRDPARLDEHEREAFLPLVRWAASTETGDIEECHGFGRDRHLALWAKLQSDSRAAIPPRHPLWRQCFYQRARRRAEAAHILVVNHALLLSDVALDFALLPSYERLVIDEAHHLADAAHEHLGRAVSLSRLRRIFHPLSEGANPGASLAGALAKAVGLPELAVPLVPRLQEEVSGCEKRFHRWLNKLSAKASKRNSETRLRYRESLTLSWQVDPTPVQEALESVHAVLSELRKALADWDDADEKGWNADLEVALSSIDEFRRDLRTLCDAADDSMVYWLEDFGNPLRLVLRSSPLDVGDLLSGRLFSVLRTGVFTSATLTFRKRMEYYARRVGLDRVDAERARQAIFPSPFRFRDQARVILAKHLPKPNDPAYQAALGQSLCRILPGIRHGTLGLFTSERSLREVRAALVEGCLREGRMLLAQYHDGNRDSLLSLFRRNEGAILLGAESFWEGVDLPGRELELVVIPRLPFPVPSDPLVSARGERAEAEGRNAFQECFLPEAYLRLRQGIGRLLRRADDRGAIVILDSRATRERYGSIFHDVWGGGHRVADGDEQVVALLQEWFAE